MFNFVSTGIPRPFSATLFFSQSPACAGSWGSSFTGTIYPDFQGASGGQHNYLLYSVFSTSFLPQASLLALT